jgi:hypothetical protein
MSNELGGVTNRSIRDSIGSRSFTSCALAIDDANVENVQTTVAVVHCVNGVFQTDLATIAEMDLSGLAVLSAKDGSVLSAAGATSATKAHPAIATGAAGGETQTIVYILACKGNVVYIIEETVDVAAAQDDALHRLSCPAGYAPFAAIKVVQVPTLAVGVAAFQLGTDDLTGITGRTASFYNLSVCPATVADMATV